MSKKDKPGFSIPLWVKVTLVIMLGTALCMWYVFESKRHANEEFLNQELRDATQRSVEVFATQLALDLVTRDRPAVTSSIAQQVTAWPEITFIQITDDSGGLFTEWKRKPMAFGEGILKFEATINYGGQVYGTVSMYINQNASLTAIRDHTFASEMRMALTLMALLMVITVLINYAAMQPVKQASDKIYELLKDRPGIDSESIGDDEITRLRSGIKLIEAGTSKANKPGEEQT